MATGENAGHAWATGSRACSWTRQLLESPRDDKVGWGEWVWVWVLTTGLRMTFMRVVFPVVRKAADG